MMQYTLSIIKPDATQRNITGAINSLIENAGIQIVAQKRLHLTMEQAEIFYDAHEDKPFFNDLCTFMSSGPVIVQVLAGEGVIDKYRDIMGATDPAKAKDGTIRKTFGLNVQENSVHGSDSEESANSEISFFFSTIEIV